MQDKADKHFRALKQINPLVKRAILLDYESDDLAINPNADNPVLNEWKRKNIDNYLLIPDAWKRAVLATLNFDFESPNLYTQPYTDLIDDFFSSENLTLPNTTTWREANATIFKLVDSKKLLFEDKNCLFEQIKKLNNDDLKINRLAVSSTMREMDLHQDVANLFDNLSKIIAD